MRFISETSCDGVCEQLFALGEIPGVLWTPDGAAGTRPLILMGHGGGQHKKAPGIAARARRFVTECGFAAAAVDAPEHGDRPADERYDRIATENQARVAAGAELAPLMASFQALVARQTVPEWRAVLDAVQELNHVGTGPVGYWGVSLGCGLGVPFVAAEPGSARRCWAWAAHWHRPRPPRGSPFRWSSWCSGTTSGCRGRRAWRCSTPWRQPRRRCTPTRAGTANSRLSSLTPRSGSSAGTWVNLAPGSSGPGLSPVRHRAGRREPNARTRRFAAPRADVGGGLAEQDALPEHVAVRVGQPVDRGEYSPMLVPADDRRLGPDGPLVRHHELFGQLVIARHALLPGSPAVDGQVPGDTEQVGLVRDVWLDAEGRQGLNGPDEDILGHVLGVGLRAGPARYGAVDQQPVLPAELIQRIAVAGARPHERVPARVGGPMRYARRKYVDAPRSGWPTVLP